MHGISVSFILTTPGLFAAGVFAVSVPIAIHLLTRWRRQPQPWGAMRFLLQAYEQQRKRMRLEQWLLLALRCLILLTLGFAMAGPVLTSSRWWAGGDTPLLILVVDNSLSSHMINDDETPRLASLTALGTQLMHAMPTGGKVSFVTLGTPSLQVSATTDHENIAKKLASLEASYSSRDITQAVHFIRTELDAQPAGAPASTIAVLSTNTMGADPWANRLLNEASTLSERVRWRWLMPESGASNVQITQVQPIEQLNVVADWRDTVDVQVTLQRFGDLSAADPMIVQLAWVDRTGQVHEAEPFRIQWNPEQAQQRLTRELAIPNVLRDNLPAQGHHLGLLAQLQTRDILPQDGTRYSSIYLIPQVRIAMQPISQRAISRSGFTSDRWLALALSGSEAEGDGMFTLQSMATADWTTQALDDVNVLLVTAPESVPDWVWANIATFVREGGVAWVMPSDAQSPATWFAGLREAFVLTNWSMAMDPYTAAEQSPVRMQTTTQAVERWPRIRRDLAALSQSVHFDQWYPLLTPTDAALLQTREAYPYADDLSIQTLLALHELGEGTLFVSAFSLDADWTNLATRPIFIPMLYEMLRDAVTRSKQHNRLQRIVSSENQAMDQSGAANPWLSLIQLDASGTQNVLQEDTAWPYIPGLYRRADTSNAQMLVLNLPAEEGNLNILSMGQLESMFDKLPDAVWLDPNDLAAVFPSVEHGARLGGWVLCLLLVWLIAETLLARWMSHAALGGTPRLVRFASQWLHRHVAMVARRGEGGSS